MKIKTTCSACGKELEVVRSYYNASKRNGKHTFYHKKCWKPVGIVFTPKGTPNLVSELLSEFRRRR